MVGIVSGGSISGGGGSNRGRVGHDIPSLGRAANSPDQGTVGASVVGNNAITSSAYGSAIPNGFGTIRMSGNIIWALAIDRRPDSIVQEPGGVPLTRDTGGGGGLYKRAIPDSGSGAGLTRDNTKTGGSLSGGSVGEKIIDGSAATTPKETYSNYATFSISFGRGIATDFLRLWADGELIFDKTGNKVDIETPNLIYRFYGGTETQGKDPAIVADKGEENTPAYRGTVHIVFEALNLEAFGGRVPNIEAEIVYQQVDARPSQVSTQIDGAVTSMTADLLAVDWNRRFAYTALSGSNPGLRRVNMLANVEDKQISGSDMITSAPVEFNNQGPNIGVMGDGSVMACIDRNSNSQPVIRLDPDTLIESARFGFSSVSTTNANNRFANTRRFTPISLKKGDGSQEHYALCSASFSSQAGILKLPDLNFIWRDNAVPGNEILGSRIRGACRGTVAEGLGEAWILSGPSYGIESAAVNELYRIRVLEGASFDINQDVTANVIISLEATFSVEDFAPGQTLLRETGALVYDQFDDSILIYSEDNSGVQRYMKYRPLEGGIVWRTQDLDNPPALNASEIESSPISESFLRGNRFGWVSSSGRGVLLDTGTGELLLNGDAPAWSPTFLGPGVYDSQSDTYTAAINNGASGEPIVRYLLNRGTDDGVSIADIITTIVENDTGLDSSDIDVSDVTNLKVDGYVLDRQVTAREAIETLTDLFLVDTFESDFQIKFRRRGTTPVRTISQDDFARINRNTPDVFRRSEVQEYELPLRYTITYLDSENDYDTNSHSPKRIIAPSPAMNSRNKFGVSLTVALTSTVAKQQAEQTLYTAWNERNSYNANLPWTHIDLDPTDVVNFSLEDGTAYRARLDEIDIGADLTLETLSIDEQAGFASTIVADGGDKLQQVVRTLLAVRTILLDIPLIDASIADPTRQNALILGLQGAYSEGQFVDAVIQKQVGEEFDTVAINLSSMLWGTVVSALPDPPNNNPYNLDTTGTFTVQMVVGGSALVNVTFEQLFSHRGVNRAALLKSNGEVEIIRFQNVTQNTDGSYTFDTLLRGHSGTDAMTNGHANGDVFILLTTLFGAPFNLELNERNVAQTYRGIGEGQLPVQGERQVFTSQHRSLLPYAPANVTAVLDGSNNIDFVWKRRDRVSGPLNGGTDAVSLSEDSEAYEIDILDGPGGNVQRAVTGLTSSAYEYLNADIITDFGSVPSQISVRVYQISAQVGRGFTREVTLDVG